MDDVEAEMAELHPAEQRVHVGSVAVDEAASGVDDPAELDGVGVEQSEGGGLGEHDAGQVVVGLGAEGVEVDVAVGGGRDGNDVESRHRGGGGVRAVGCVGDEHLAAAALSTRFTTRLVPCIEGRADGEDACKLAVGAR